VPLFGRNFLSGADVGSVAGFEHLNACCGVGAETIVNYHGLVTRLACDAVRRLDPSLVCNMLDMEGLTKVLGQVINLATKPATANAVRIFATEFAIDGIVSGLISIYKNLQKNIRP
jgi:hypothetical protein